MNNRYYSYEGIGFWQESQWRWRTNQLVPLVKWLQEHKSHADADNYDEALLEKKRAQWEERGLILERHFIGGRWLTIVPNAACRNRRKRLTTLVVFHCEEENDPQWEGKTLWHYQSYNDMAASDNMILLYIVMEKGKRFPEYWSILMEAGAMYAIDYERIYMDLSGVYEAGCTLMEIPQLALSSDRGEPLKEPDMQAERFSLLEIPVLDISRKWQNRYGSNRSQVMGVDGVAGFCASDYIHTESGRKQSAALRLEYYHDTIDDLGFRRYWMQRGLTYTVHDMRGDRWISLMPLSAQEDSSYKLPVLVMLQEVYSCNDHYPVEAFSYYYEYCRLAAQGEFIGIFWSAERPEDHEPLVQILHQVAGMYPADMTRVYITGHSHNGHYGYEFARRHTELITAVATLGNSCGLSASNHFALSDEKLDELASKDIPLVNLAGFNEAAYRFLINRRGEFVPEEWQRRLRASNCPPKTAEEIAAAAQSEDYVIRKLGIPGDKTEVLYLDNREHYILDVRNNQGRYHLRMVIADNAPHNPTPSLQILAWSYLRRFSRDPATLQIHEDY